MASLYRRGKVWWAKTYRNGKMVRQSLRTTDKREARRRLREREAYITSVPQITASDWTWDDAARR
jgi:type II secretory pathway component PulF